MIAFVRAKPLRSFDVGGVEANSRQNQVRIAQPGELVSNYVTFLFILCEVHDALGNAK